MAPPAGQGARCVVPITVLEEALIVVVRREHNIVIMT